MKTACLGLALGLAASALSAQAAIVGVYGNYPDPSYVSSGLSGFGHTVVSVASADAASLAGLDALVIGRYQPGNPSITAFVDAGGVLITEWSSASYGMSLLGGSASDNYNSFLTGDPVTFTGAGLAAGLGLGLGASYSDGGATEFFQDFASIGSGEVFARRGSNAAVAIVGGSVGRGYAWINGYDWGDWGSARTFTLINNELKEGANGRLPEPASISLLGAALFGVAVLRRKARRS